VKKKILIFDDDADICEVCTILLEDNGFEAYTESNCDEILQKLRHVLPDVILMDNKIPPFGGIPASQAIRASADYGRVPIVFFSANQDVARLAAEAGADSYIEKPFDLHNLVRVLQNASTSKP
jgi:two-component system cell cycle response regulator DivK